MCEENDLEKERGFTFAHSMVPISKNCPNYLTSQSYKKSTNLLPSGSYGTKLGSTGFFRLCFKFDRFSEFSEFFDGFSTFSPNPDETSLRFRTPFRSCCPEQKSRISDVINRVEIKRSFVCDVIWKEKQICFLVVSVEKVVTCKNFFNMGTR